jgi:hypothetical protein
MFSLSGQVCDLEKEGYTSAKITMADTVRSKCSGMHNRVMVVVIVTAMVVVVELFGRKGIK